MRINPGVRSSEAPLHHDRVLSCTYIPIKIDIDNTHSLLLETLQGWVMWLVLSFLVQFMVQFIRVVKCVG